MTPRDQFLPEHPRLEIEKLQITIDSPWMGKIVGACAIITNTGFARVPDLEYAYC